MRYKRVILFSIFLILSIFAAGCSKTPDPKDTFQAYIAEWQKKDFASMYKRLSTDAKKSILEEDFIKRHQNIYDGIEVSSISITPNYPEKIKPDDKGNINIPYSVKMETLAGTVEFTHSAVLVKEKGEKGSVWLVNWNHGMIFPQLEADDKVRAESYKAKRGEIKDRNGKGLAVNGYGASIGIVPEKLGQDGDKIKRELSSILNISVEEIDKKLNEKWVKPNLFVPITILSKDDERIKTFTGLQGVRKQDVPMRVYPYKYVTAHLIGYVGQISDKELEELKGQGYDKDDIIGKAGLEQVFEKRLKGEDGGIIYIVDSKGNKKTTIAEKKAKNGEDIQLTIDIFLQESIYNQLQGDSGAVSAINPKTGEVLAMVSAPSYDPNLFVLGISQDRWTALNNDAKKPMLNRFTATYAPGSTFKTITAAIGLKTGKISTGEEVNISGLQWQESPSWGDYYVKRVKDPGEPVNLEKALMYSDNIYFAKAALKIGRETFLQEAKNFGIGETIPFEYPIKSSQLIKGNDFKNDIQLADSGYGQGEVEVSPLHLAIMYTPILNEGNMIMPTLEMKNGAVSPKVWKEKVITPEISNILLKDLIQVVENPKGTAYDGKIQGISMAGKTGTAELIKQSKDDKSGKENGWFVAFNTDNPKLLVSMMVEDVKAQGGSHYVVPKIKKIIEEYLK